MNRTERVNIRLTSEEVAALDDMAKEAEQKRSALAASIIREVLRDDAAAHGGKV